MADFSSLLGAAGIGGAIGKAIVQLELDTAKYQTELKAAQGQTVASTNAMGSGVSNLAGIAKTGFAALGVAAVAGIGASINAAIEANEAHLKLQNTFENNPRLSDSSVAAFEAQAESLRALTGVDDEAIISSQALLGQFDLTGDQVKELTPLIVDLSAKMGIDLETAARAVGKATQGNTGTLARYGIEVDAADTASGKFSATLEGLAVAEGFAADRADNEPWRVLRSDLEELGEEIGQALIPAVQSFADALKGLLPVLEFVAEGIKFLPLAQMGEDLEEIKQRTDDGGTSWKDYADLIFDTVPILGHYIDVSGEAGDATDENANIITHISDVIRIRYMGALDIAGNETSKFAKMSRKEFAEWSEDTQESLRKATLSLEDLGDASEVTGRKFIKSQREMLEDARLLSQAMREISNRSHEWVPDDYIKFLNEQGPGALVGFADLTEKQQKRMVEQWEEGTRGFDRTLRRTFDDFGGILKELDNKTTKHIVRIKYEYEGFDPTKPGMSGSNQVR